MPTKFAGITIGNWLRDKFRTNLETELGLKTVSHGSLEDFDAIKTLSTHVPAVFIKAQRVAPGLLTVNGQTWSDEYFYRVVYIAPIPEDWTHQETARFQIERFADIVRENYLGTGLSGLPSSVQHLHAEPREIEYRPPEDNYDDLVQARLNAMAMVVRVWLLSTIL